MQFFRIGTLAEDRIANNDTLRIRQRGQGLQHDVLALPRGKPADAADQKSRWQAEFSAQAIAIEQPRVGRYRDAIRHHSYSVALPACRAEGVGNRLRRDDDSGGRSIGQAYRYPDLLCAEMLPGHDIVKVPNQRTPGQGRRKRCSSKGFLRVGVDQFVLARHSSELHYCPRHRTQKWKVHCQGAIPTNVQQIIQLMTNGCMEAGSFHMAPERPILKKEDFRIRKEITNKIAKYEFSTGQPCAMSCEKNSWRTTFWSAID
jgi:hypothetical protein